MDRACIGSVCSLPLPGAELTRLDRSCRFLEKLDHGSIPKAEQVVGEHRRRFDQAAIFGVPGQ